MSKGETQERVFFLYMPHDVTLTSKRRDEEGASRCISLPSSSFQWSFPVVFPHQGDVEVLLSTKARLSCRASGTVDTALRLTAVRVVVPHSLPAESFPQEQLAGFSCEAVIN